MNSEYIIRVSAPLLCPGMEIESGPVSEKDVVDAAVKMMDFVREINDAQSEAGDWFDRMIKGDPNGNHHN